MNRTEWWTFYCWLEEASIEELESRNRDIIKLLEILTEDGVIADAQRMKREIQAELLGRL